MIYQHRYVSLEVLKLLIKKHCPLITPIISVRNPRIPAYYTKSPNQKGFEDCDAYYYPTQDQVIDWLEAEHKIFISTFPIYDFNKINRHIINKYGVHIKNAKAKEHGCQQSYKTKEDAINAALLKVLKELI